MSTSGSEPLDVLAEPDPVEAVAAAHRAARRIAVRTSGTTGRPRLVVRTTASWYDSFPAVAALTGLGPGASVWLPGPPTASMNLFASVLASRVGAVVVDRLDDATHAHLTPHVLRRLLARRDTLGGVHLTVAGDRLPRVLHDRAADAGAAVSHYLGAAELSFVAWGRHEDDLRPFPGVEVEFRNGVLWARSPFLAEGYAEGSTEAVCDEMGPLRRDARGFATVGDRADVRRDGTVAVHGRGDEVVLTGAATVLVADVEAALRPALSGEVAVLGEPYEPLGDVVVAVLTEVADLAAARLRAEADLQAVQRPRRWYLVPELPLTEAGKVDRPALLGLLVQAERLPARAEGPA